jgi:hypothetical protein
VKNSSRLAVYGALFLLLLCCSSCQRKLGWGVLLWANETRGIPSGTVLPVYIKSNIEKKWIVGIPKEYQAEGEDDIKIEIPLSQLELAGSEREARRRAAEFSEFALDYAETMQDGLPVREHPDNSAPRVYRLRIGEIIKIISRSEGAPAISTTGDKLPGEWYRVLTQDGTRGYCFSYRLSFFKHTTGSLTGDTTVSSNVLDTTLERIQSKVWSAEIYDQMLNDRKFNIDALAKHWSFSTGEDTGIANIYTQNIDKSFRYTAIRKTGEWTWRFEGTSLTMRLLSDNLLALEFLDNEGIRQLLHFVALPTSIDDLIVQEKNRREAQYQSIYKLGPAFASATFGVLTLTPEAEFLWEDFELLVPDYIPISAIGRGVVELRYHIADALLENFDGVITLRFKTIGGPDRNVNFLYKAAPDNESGALRLEFISPSNILDNVVIQQNESPMILYFYSMID